MSISRIGKMVRELGKLESLGHAAVLRQKDIDLVLAPCSTSTVSAMAATAVELSLRCLNGEIRIHLPPTDLPILPWWKTGLAEHLQGLAANYGAPERIRIVHSGGYGPMRLGLGCRIEGGVSADAAGWTAGINRLLAPRPATAMPAAAFAVAAAFSKLFKAHVLNDSTFFDEEWTLSLADFDVHEDSGAVIPPADFDLGFIGILGAGAIGSALIHVLSLSPWRATVDLIDRQAYDEPNQETTFFIGISEARQRRLKVVALAELAARPGLVLNSIEHEVIAGSKLLGTRRNAFVSAVDNSPTRRVLDSVNAELLLNAGVGGSREDAGHIALSRHLPGDMALSKRYQDAPEIVNTASLTPPAEITDPCSYLAYQDASLAAPFMALAAGALLGASLVHRATGYYPAVNYLKFDLLRIQSSFRRDSPRSA